MVHIAVPRMYPYYAATSCWPSLHANINSGFNNIANQYFFVHFKLHIYVNAACQMETKEPLECCSTFSYT